MEVFIRQRPRGHGVYDYRLGTHIIIKYNDRAVKRHANSAEASLGRFDNILQELSGEQELVFVNAGVKREKQGEVSELSLSFRGKSVVAILEKYDKDEYAYRLRRFEPVTVDAFAEEEQYKKEVTGCVAFLMPEENPMDYLVDNGLASRDIINEYEALRQEVFSLKAPFRVLEAARMRKVWQAYIKGERELLDDKRMPIVVKSVSYRNSGKERLADVEVDLNETSRLEQKELQDILISYPDVDIKSKDNRIDVHFSDYTQLSEQTIREVNQWCDEYHYGFSQDGITYRLIGEVELLNYDEVLKEGQKILADELTSFGIAHRWEIEEGTEAPLLHIMDDTALLRVEQIYEYLRAKAKISAGITLKREVANISLPIKMTTIPKGIENSIKSIDRNCLIKPYRGYIVVITRFPLNTARLEEVEGIALNDLRAVYTLSHDGVRLEKLDNGIVQDAQDTRRLVSSIPLHNLGKAGYYYGVIREQDPEVRSEYKYLFTIDLKEDLQDLRLKLNSDAIDVQVSSSSVVLHPKSEQHLSNALRMISTELPEYLSIDDSVDLTYREGYRLLPTVSLEEKMQREWNNLNNAFVLLRSREGVKISSNKDKLSIKLELPFVDEADRDDLFYRVNSLLSELDFADNVETYWVNKLGETTFTLLFDERAAAEYDEQLQKESRQEEVALEHIEEKEYSTYVKGGGGRQEKKTKKTRKYDVIGVCLKRSVGSLTIKLNNVDAELKSGDVLSFRYQGEASNIDRQLAAMSSISGDSYKTTWGKYIDPGALVNPKLKDFIFDPRCAEAVDFADSGMLGVDSLGDAARYIKETAIEKNINQKQCEAVARALWAKDISIIQGPPGTGKTTVIAEMIYQEIKRNPDCRILLTSQTNLAVDNALERLKGKANIRPIRIMRKDKSNKSDGAIYMEAVMHDWVDKGETDCILSHWVEKIHNKCINSPLYAEYKEELEPYISSLRASDEHLRREFHDMYLKGVNLVAATCSICGNEKMFRDACRRLYSQGANESISFDVVIIDEASKATPLELAIPMVLGKKIILIGDHKQLPAMLSREEVEVALEKTRKDSLQEDLKLMMDNPQFKYMFTMAQEYQPSILSSLDTQYRMHYDIMQTVSHIYKEDIMGGLQCGIKEGMDDPDILGNRASRYHGLTSNPILAPDIHAVWIDNKNSEVRVGTSYANHGEVRAVESVLKRLESAEGFAEYQATRQIREDQEIAVITFYGAQAGALEKHLRGKFPNLKLRVDVVDNFQGMERDIVIVSTVRSNNRGNLGFAKEIERINVAFSRARRLLVVVGDKDLFSRHEVYRTSIGQMHQVASQML